MQVYYHINFYKLRHTIAVDCTNCDIHSSNVCLLA